MEPLETITYKNKTISIVPDPYPESPRTWDNLTEFHCCHKRYSLGDEHFNYSTTNDCITIAKQAKLQNDIVLPLYLYDHSGITISLSPFSCPWDSGQIGFVIIRRSKMLQEFSVKKLTKALKTKAIQIAHAEVETYDLYLRGQVYGYQIDEEGDSCWGFYSQEECIEQAKGSVDDILYQSMQQHCQQVKKWILNKVPLNDRTRLV